MKYEVVIGSRYTNSKLPDETLIICKASSEIDAAFIAGQRCQRIGWTVKSIRTLE